MKEVQNALKSNKLIEVFGAGTACVVAPVNRIKFQNRNINFPMDNESEKISPRLLAALTDIYYGKVPHQWMQAVDEV